MPLQTFTPSIAPSPGTKHTSEVKLHKAEFGNGYTQAAPAGMRHIRRNVSLKWDALTEDQYHELETFFVSLGGFRPFWYQPRGYLTREKWTCKSWSGSDSSPWRFDADLAESFTIES